MTLAIRADADAQIGVGHVMRSVALAEAWGRTGGESILFTVSPPPFARAAAERRGVAVRSHGSNEAAWHALVEWVHAHQGEWVAFDSYALGPDAHRAIRRAGARLLVIDDGVGHHELECDVLVNQNVGADALGYRVDSGTHCCFGPKYALLRSEFVQPPPERRFDSTASRLVVTFGGADAHHQADRVAKIIMGLTPPIDATIVSGLALTAARADADRGGIRLRWRAPAADLAPTLAAADMVICAAGGTCWELARLGVPALTVVVADNQRPVAAGLHGAGVIRHAGWFDAVSDAELASAIETLRHDDARTEMSRRGRALVDGLGADRVVEVMRLTAVEA